MKLIRNRGCVPHLNTEGIFLKPLTNIKYGDKENWYENLTPFQRMHAHQTLASVRRFAYFKPHSGLIPKDDLDFVLNSHYNQSKECFPDPIDIYLQPDTVRSITWRRLQNTRNFIPKPLIKEKSDAIFVKLPTKDDELVEKPKKSSTKTGVISKDITRVESDRIIPYRYNEYHPVVISGIEDKRHPSNIKLMNSSHHQPQTNAGYTRQGSDGNVFQY